MSGLRWGQFENLYLIGVLIFWVFIYIYTEKRNQKKLNQAFGQKLAPWLAQSVSYSRLRLKLILNCFGALCVIIALARPQLGQSQQEVKSEGVELLFVFDVSDSMLAEDVKPSRLDRAKIELEKLIDLMPGNKMGLIAFAGSSALISPLTTDPGALKMYIQSLDTNAVSSQGTDFSSALSYVKEAFEKGGVTQSESQKTTRVAVIISDGEDHEKDALVQAENLAKDNIHLITVAYGTEKGSTIPARDRLGQLVGVRKDSSGQPIITQVKGDFLKSLADKNNGYFIKALTSGDHVKDIAAVVEKYEKSEFSSALTLQYNEVFIYPLIVGFILLLSAFFIITRHNYRKPLEVTYE